MDNCGNAISLVYQFESNENAILVELRNANNDSFYQGGEIIEVTVSGINDTLKFEWDNYGELDGLDDAYFFNSTLILNETNMLPVFPVGEHYLTIRTFDGSDIEYVYLFKFTLDQEAPLILTSKDDYNNQRFFNTEVLEFTFNDNFTLLAQLDVIISVDGITNYTLNHPFEFDLLSFSDGTYNLTIYVYDIADNYASESYIITIDTLAPDIEILNMDEIVTLQGQNYISADFNVSVLISDDDNQTYSSYSWGGTAYDSFNDSFVLSFTDGTAVLYINASDSLGNENEIMITLILDGTEPISTLIFPFVDSKVNYITRLEFLVEDLSRDTISLVKYSWDAYADSWTESTPNSLGELEFYGPPSFLYTNGSTAVLSIYVEDIVGNNHTYTYSFLVDNKAPVFEVLLYVEETEQWNIINATDTYTLQNDSQIWINVNNVENTFVYFWDLESDRPVNKSTWLISDIPEYGRHNLTILAYDNTGERMSPNEITVIFHFAHKMEGNLLI